MGKCKTKRAFENGGSVSRAEQLIAEMNAKYGLGSNSQPAQPTAPPVQQATQPQQQQPQQRSLVGNALNMIGNRQKQIDKAAGYRNGGKISGPGTPTSDSVPATVRETGEEIAVSNKERILSADQDALLEAMARKSGFESLDAMLEAGTGKPVGPTIKGGKVAAENGYSPWYEKDPLTSLASGIRENMNSSESANNQLKALYPSGTFTDQQPSQASANAANLANQPVSGIASNPLVANKDRFPISAPGSGFMTGKDGAMPDSSGGGFVSGKTAYNVNPTSQDGISRVTAQGKNPLITNIRPESAVAGLSNQSIGQPADQEAQGLARIANANKIRGEMIAGRDKDIPPGGYGPGILGDGGIAADNAEKTRRWRNDDLVALATRGNQGAIMEAMRADNQANIDANRSDIAREGMNVSANNAAAHNAITMRGQDLNAQNEANRLAGNPLEQQAKKLSLADAQRISQLKDRALAGDRDAIASLNLLNGSDQKSHFTSHVVGGGEDEMGRKLPQRLAIFDSRTGQEVQQNGQRGQVPPAPASAIEFLKKNPGQAEAFKSKYGYLPAGF